MGVARSSVSSSCCAATGAQRSAGTPSSWLCWPPLPACVCCCSRTARKDRALRTGRPASSARSAASAVTPPPAAATAAVAPCGWADADAGVDAAPVGAGAAAGAGEEAGAAADPALASASCRACTVTQAAIFRCRSCLSFHSSCPASAAFQPPSPPLILPCPPAITRHLITCTHLHQLRRRRARPCGSRPPPIRPRLPCPQVQGEQHAVCKGCGPHAQEASRLACDGVHMAHGVVQLGQGHPVGRVLEARLVGRGWRVEGWGA